MLPFAMFDKIYKSLDFIKYTPFHPQWVANSYHKRKIKLIKKYARNGKYFNIGSGDDKLVASNLPTKALTVDFPTTSCRYRQQPDIFGDAQALPIPDNSTDGIILFEVLEHIPDELSAISEISRVLKPSGLLFISVPFLYPSHDEPFDFKRYSEHGLRKLLTDYGLDTLETLKHGNSITTACQLMNLALLDATKNTSKTSVIVTVTLLPFTAIACLFFNCFAFIFYRLKNPNSLNLGHTFVAQKRG